MKEEKTIRYSNDSITVLWRPDVCIHSGVCVRGLKAVFDPSRRKWVDVNAASADVIKAQIDRCPSKALGYEGQVV